MGKYIGERFDLILNQTLQADEIIVYDECSAGSTLSILKRHQEINVNIKIITSKPIEGIYKTFITQ